MSVSRSRLLVGGHLIRIVIVQQVVPGSHKSGLAEVPECWAGKPPLVDQPSAPAGSVLVYNGHTWHAGGASTSDVLRCSIFGHDKPMQIAVNRPVPIETPTNGGCSR